MWLRQSKAGKMPQMPALLRWYNANLRYVLFSCSNGISLARVLQVSIAINILLAALCRQSSSKRTAMASQSTTTTFTAGVRMILCNSIGYRRHKLRCCRACNMRFQCRDRWVNTVFNAPGQLGTLDHSHSFACTWSRRDKCYARLHSRRCAVPCL
eukprot:COSAG02_NODE_4756_length_5022_cov_1.825107_2_plen_155_part_00